jgi:ABC-type glycerol-3-phosphate transport system substrate-binding protein
MKERLFLKGKSRNLGISIVVASLTMSLATVMQIGPSSGAPVTTIKVLSWEPGNAKFWKNTVAAFEKANPTIKVKMQNVPNNQYMQVQGPYITSKSGPDIMANNAGLEIADRKSAYLPLPGSMLAIAKKNLVSYSGACLGFNPKNPCYGIPFSYQGNVMYYNKALLTKAGLDPENPPKTMAEFGVACKAIKASGNTCLALGLQGQFPSYWDFPEIARNYLTEADMRSVLAGKMPWTNPKMVKVLQGLATVTSSGWTNTDAPSIAMLPDAANLFSSGKAAFAGTIISDAVNWQAFGTALGDENVGAMLWPTLVSNAPLANSFSGIEGSVYGVTAWSKNRAASFKFLEWLAGPVHASLWVKDVGGISLYRNVDKKALPSSPALAQILKIIAKPTLHVGVLLSSQETDALSRGWQQVALGEITVAEWTASMQAALEASPSKQ